jgi:hypothetical protein
MCPRSQRGRRRVEAIVAGSAIEIVVPIVAEQEVITGFTKYLVVPRIAPGLEQPWKPGSPDCAQRLLATFQTIRHRASVLITPAEDGGFFVDVKVLKELEELGIVFQQEETMNA